MCLIVLIVQYLCSFFLFFFFVQDIVCTIITYYAVSQTQSCIFLPLSNSDIILFRCLSQKTYICNQYTATSIAFNICNCAKYSFIVNSFFFFIHSVEPITLIDNSMSNYTINDYYTVKEKCLTRDIWGLSSV